MTAPDLSEGVCYKKKGLLPLFFSDNTADQNTAKRLCFRCPVQFECLEYGMTERFGIWGGVLPGERAAILRLRKEPVCTTYTSQAR